MAHPSPDPGSRGQGTRSLDDLRAIAPSRRGARAAPKLADAAGQPLTRPPIEYEVLRKLGATEPNARIGTDEDDLYSREHALVVELDTDQTHGTKWARERDARKDQRMQRRGIRVGRFTA